MMMKVPVTVGVMWQVVVLVSLLLLGVSPVSSHKPSSRPADAKFVASIVRSGLIDCFPAGLTRKKRKKRVPVYCETSAVAVVGEQVWVASDKPIPGKGRSSLMYLRFDPKRKSLDWGSPRYVLDPLIKRTRKIEDFALTPDKRFVIGTSGFDRVRADGSWDAYNTLLYWRVGQARVQQFQASRRDPVRGQIPLRQCLSKALSNTEFPGGAPYFKVEGLAVLPNQTMLFGIRESGARYNGFQYNVKLVAVPYQEKDGKLSLGNTCKQVYDATTRARRTVGVRVALSSLTYDSVRKVLFLLTSYEQSETAKGLGGFLWRLSLDDLKHNRAPTLARTPSGAPLIFAHKAEAVAMLDAHTLLVFHDDDRVLGQLPVRDPIHQFFRRPHQAAYTLVNIK